MLAEDALIGFANLALFRLLCAMRSSRYRVVESLPQVAEYVVNLLNVNKSGVARNTYSA